LESHPAILYFFSKATFLAVFNPQVTTILVILLLTLVILSFIVSGAEVAFFSLNHKDINLLKTKQQPAYKRIIDLLEEPKLLLGSLLIANSVTNIAIIIISSLVIDQTIHFTTNMMWADFVLKIILVTCLLLLFCEVMPKVLAKNNNIRFAEYSGIIVEILYYIFKRMGVWLVKYTDVIEKKLGSDGKGQYSMEELDHAIGITYSEENQDEKNILMGIAKFGNITVKQIMRSRLDVNGIEEKTNFADLVKRIEELHYSRLPVYKNDLDEVIGIINTKDMLPYINEAPEFDWHVLIRAPYFVHEQKLIEDLLHEFQSKRIHFAVVVDEFGGTSGIVTLEDVLEEIIGEIKDEFDEEEGSFKKIDDSNYIFDGKTMLNDVCKVMELPVDTFDVIKGDSESLAGLVLELAGEIPSVNEVVPTGDFEFTVLEAVKNRLQKIKVSIKPKPEE
jgi:gliding motility-associated protein GldE